MSRQRTGITNIRRCRLSAIALFFTLPALAATAAGFRDPVFERLGFDRWPAGNQSHLKWSVEVPPPELSTHQRLLVRVVTKIDGRELEKRRGEGEVLALLQITDQAGHVWQNHTSIDLSTLPPNVQNSEYFITHYAFLLPGDYSMVVAACNSRDGDRSVTTKRIHVDPVKGDPLPDSFAGLPAVEFVPPTDGTPDVWFIPDVDTRLRLRLETKRRLHLQIVVNTTPSGRSLGSASALHRNMSLVIPAMKLLAGIEVPNGSVEVSLLELDRQAVTFQQKSVDKLDWYSMSKVFAARNSGVVDIATLANEWRMRGFFLEELNRRMQAPLEDNAVRVVIVLSGPAFIDDPNKIVFELLPGDEAQQQLYYIRLRTLPVRYPPRNRPGGRMMPQRPTVVDIPMPNDDLGRVAAALNGKVFDATSTEKFRRVLATILEQIAKY